VDVSHLDRLIQPHLPSCVLWRPKSTATGAAISSCLEQQRVYALGWPTLTKEQQGFNVESALSWTTTTTPAPAPPITAPSLALLSCKFQLKQVVCSEDVVLLLSQQGKLYNWHIAKPEAEPQLIDFPEIANETFVSIASHCEGRHFLAIDSNCKCLLKFIINELIN